MVYRIAAGLYFLFIGLAVASLHVPALLLTILALIAGLALLIGF